MRRLAVLAGVGVWWLVGAVAPAQATFHLEKVNEVMLASSGQDPNVQFVEVVDHGGTEEAFTPVFGPYELVVYDAAGAKVGQHMLDPNGLRSAAAADAPYLISTAAADAALAVKGDERLDVSLPVTAGQACFEANPTPPAISCLTWGAITKAVPTNSQGTGSVNGPVPPAGESDQRQSDGSVVAAAPTPKAPNRAATGGTTKPPTMVPPAFAGMSFSTRSLKIDSRGRAPVRLRCPAGTDGSCQGRLTLAPPGGGRAFGRATFDIAAAKSATVRVDLSASAARSLRRHGRLAARGRAVAHDVAASSKTTSANLTILRRSP